MSIFSCQAATTPDVEKITEPGIRVRPAMSSELDDVAWLRAEAFYEASSCQWRYSAIHHQIKLTVPAHFREDQHRAAGSHGECMVPELTAPLPLQDQLHQRYVGSFKRQFKEQEARSLHHRTRQRPGQAGPDCVCLAAVKKSDSSSAEVVGTLDVESPGSALAQGQKLPEVRLSPDNGSIVGGDQSSCLRDAIALVARGS